MILLIISVMAVFAVLALIASVKIVKNNRDDLAAAARERSVARKHNTAFADTVPADDGYKRGLELMSAMEATEVGVLSESEFGELSSEQQHTIITIFDGYNPPSIDVHDALDTCDPWGRNPR